MIKDWYKEVTPFSKKDIALLKAEPIDETSFKKEFGIRDFVGKKKGLELKKALAGDPTCNIAGMISGYTGQGAKTVLPSRAVIKLDFRLVPKMDPKKQIVRLKKHLKQKGFGDIAIKVYHGEAAARTDPEESFVKNVKISADKIYGQSIVNVSNAGTGPMHSFVKFLKAPCIAIGSTYIFAKIHSPNEFTRINKKKKTTKCICLIMKKF